MNSESYFFNTFGYLTVPIKKTNIIKEFDDDISLKLNLPFIDKNHTLINGENGRYSTLGNSEFYNDQIYSIFYNKNVLDILYKLTNDFIILSPFESFHLTSSGIHRDFSGEIKTIKIIFYLDDLSDLSKGPLYVIPGTQNIYDKYSSQMGNIVSWPPNFRECTGSGFTNYHNYFLNEIPKNYLFSNQDKIIFFNNSILHGSDGNLINNNLLRRAIAMTVVCVDRTNLKIMESINKIFYNFNIKNKSSGAYLYCLKNQDISSIWLKHFYEYEETNDLNNNINDQTGIIRSEKMKRFKNYTDFLDNNSEEFFNSRIYNCFEKQIKEYSI